MADQQLQQQQRPVNHNNHNIKKKRTRLHNVISQRGFPYEWTLSGHTGCVNCLAFSRDGQFLASGSDDCSVFLWPILGSIPGSGCTPCVKMHGHKQNVFSVVFDPETPTRILSCGLDGLIHFYDYQNAPNMEQIAPFASFDHHTSAVFQVSISPDNGNVFLSASEDGSVALFDARASESPQNVLATPGPMTGVQWHPVPGSTLFLTSSKNVGCELWDTRSAFNSQTYNGYLRRVMQYNHHGFRDCTAATWNSTGTQFIASVKRSYPTLHSIYDLEPITTFHSANYQNSCTVKSCAFAGPSDEFVISGSDDWRVYLWSIPESSDLPELFEQAQQIRPPQLPLDARGQRKRARALLNRKINSLFDKVPCVPEAERVFIGHRSIVNNVRYHPVLPIIASAGVEKIIRLWGTYPFSSREEDNEITIGPPALRLPASLSEVISSLHDSDEEETTEESLKTLVLFDFYTQIDAPSDEDIPWQALHGLEEDDDDDNDNDNEDDDDDSSETDSLTQALSSEIGISLLGIAPPDDESDTDAEIRSSFISVLPRSILERATEEGLAYEVQDSDSSEENKSDE